MLFTRTYMLQKVIEKLVQKKWCSNKGDNSQINIVKFNSVIVQGKKGKYLLVTSMIVNFQRIST